MHSLFKFTAAALLGLAGTAGAAQAHTLTFTGEGLTGFVVGGVGAAGPVAEPIDFTFSFTVADITQTISPTLLSDPYFLAAEAELTLDSTGIAIADYSPANVRVEITEVIAATVYQFTIDGLDPTASVQGAADFFIFTAYVDVTNATFFNDLVAFGYETYDSGGAHVSYAQTVIGTPGGLYTVTDVPVPAAAPLMLGALAAFGVVARRRRGAA